MKFNFGRSFLNAYLKMVAGSKAFSKILRFLCSSAENPKSLRMEL
jgi:hypothetical protein